MKIEVFLTPFELTGKRLEGKIAVVIDLLRATSTVVTALLNGCIRVFPVETVEEAFGLRSSLVPDRPILGGERKGMRIDGFDLGNSPYEYVQEVVSGRSVILTTTNGTAAIKNSRVAAHLYTCSLMNLSATARHLLDVHPEGEIVLVCAGRAGRMSLEDTYCAGRLIDVMINTRDDIREDSTILDDGAKAAIAIADSWADALEVLRLSDHGRYLEEIGYGRDLEMCGSQDTCDKVVVYRDSCLKLSV